VKTENICLKTLLVRLRGLQTGVETRQTSSECFSEFYTVGFVLSYGIAYKTLK